MTLSVPVIPESAPFTAEQRAWLNGYLAGLMARGAPDPVVGAALPPPRDAGRALAPLTILYGSQTGTAESLAKRAAKEAGQRGFAATAMDMAGFACARLAQEKNVLVIVSTYGDGEPPDGAKPLHAALAASETAPLPHVHFSVCALGDSNYPQFCQCGKDFDARLGRLGAIRVADRVDCDVDHEKPFAAWLDLALSQLAGGAGAAAVVPAVPAVAVSRAAVATGPSRANPFVARLLASRRLNARGSGKQVHHVAFSLADSGLRYEPGDALGVFPQNCPQLVGEILEALGYDGEEAVPAPDGASVPLRRALLELCDLGKPTAELHALCPVAAAGEASPTEPHVADVLRCHPGLACAPEDFVRALRNIQPRLYSIASSPAAHIGEVHLTVGAVRYELEGRARKGVCSTFLAERVPANATARIFLHSNPAFRLPADRAAPVIMVGPGTGIAPFRAFLHERRATGAAGKNWLFFGDQHAATDFLYREELAALQTDGTLARLDTAFSRDQAEKIYVQHRLLEKADEVFSWLEAGAHFYVCGDASRMAKDVDVALHAVIEKAGQRSADESAEYVRALKAAKRYARDVY